MIHLYPNFLTNAKEYAEAEAYWDSVWQNIPEANRIYGKWRSGWLQTPFPKDGNPIFTAISDSHKKGIRVIQYEPSDSTMEIDFWLDTFGGGYTDPDAIRELVIACALTPESGAYAVSLMSAWTVGQIELAHSAGSFERFTFVKPVSRQRWVTTNRPAGRIEPAA